MSLPAGPTPLIGRGRELATMRARLTAASSGAGGAIVLAGEAGMGKSRLVAEVLADAARQQFALLRGGCYETDRTLPYAPLLDLLRGIVAGQLPGEAAPRLGPGAQRLLALLPEFAPLVPGGPAAAPDAEQDKQLILQAFAGLVAELAAARPVLIAIEDIHWSDEASLDLFLALARRLAAQPVLLLLTH